jgi:hypothetical protein
MTRSRVPTEPRGQTASLQARSEETIKGMLGQSEYFRFRHQDEAQAKRIDCPILDKYPSDLVGNRLIVVAAGMHGVLEHREGNAMNELARP